MTRPPVGNWYVLRVSTAMLHPGHARQTLGLMMMTGSLALAEVFAPAAEESVAIIGDQPGASWTEIHVCLDCYVRKLGALAGAVEDAGDESDSIGGGP